MALYRLLLRLFPKGFRERFGQDMAEVFDDRRRIARRQGAWATIRLAADTVIDLLVHAAAERRRGRSHRPGGAMTLTLLQDIRFAVRAFRRQPTFTAVALATIALGIGANVAIFSVVRPLLIDRLPFPDADRVVEIYQNTKANPTMHNVSSGANFNAWEQSPVFSAIAAYINPSRTLTGAGDPIRLRTTLAMPSLFAVFGMRPAIGRAYTAEEASAGAKVVVIADKVWRERFNADPSIVGRTIQLDSEAWQVIGVMPPAFDAPDETTMWLPFALPAAERADRNSYYLGVAARLAPGQTPASASAAATSLVAQIDAGTRAASIGRGAYVVGWKENLVGLVKDGLLLLQAVALVVLLVACANLANLLLAHASGRSRELGIRASLGAGRGRIVRQLITEGLVLSLTGGMVGVLIAVVAVPALAALAPTWLPRADTLSVRLPELVAALALATITGIVFSVVPAFFAARGGERPMVGGSRGGTATRGQRLTRGALVVAQTALALVLISGAGLLIRSFLNLSALPIGFDSSQVLTAQISLPPARYSTMDQQRRFFLDLIDRVGHEPGVVATTASTALPFTWYEWAQRFPVIGRADVKTVLAPFRMIGPDYFRVLGVPIVRGRGPTSRDIDGTPLVGFVNEQFARDQKALGDVIGLQLDAAGLFRDPLPHPLTIVGVIGDTKQRSRDVPPQGELYVPLAQTGASLMTLAIRTAGSPMALVPRLRADVGAVDPELPLTDVKTLADWVGTSVAERRFYMVLLGLFAALAGVLAAGGIYGVTSYLVGLRMREIGIRLALGATAGGVRSLVIRQGMSPVLIGTAIGAVVTLFATKLLRDQLFQIEPRDPITLVSAAGLFLAAGLAACWLPSTRTSNADPATVLRSE